ncbi:MAG: hypothetical protein A3E87_01430 [Gammaproteobacteria bacterium RIFCSPHIGHO2_12_FULL_35_23]|nr:MAG: hypothetical protein A3E87_01430 [Gammaproteobacteria bacterium RIFCSPHIGHO2_12_FULL_35_23]
MPTIQGINSKKCFLLGKRKLSEIALASIEHHFPDSWVTNFCKLFPAAIQTELVRHLGPDATYCKKEALKSKLKIIYARLLGLFDTELGKLSVDEKEAIKTKITDSITECTPGFHNRVNFIALGFSISRTLTDLLYDIRFGIVEATVYGAIPRGSIDVHVHNNFFTIASELYGIYPINREDVYSGEVSSVVIRATLKSEFESKYVPHILFDSLIERMTNILSRVGYTGKKKPGFYTHDQYSKFIDTLEMIFEIRLNPEEIFCTNGDGNVIDLNWTAIKKQLLCKLILEKYFFITAKLLVVIDAVFGAEKAAFFKQTNTEGWNCLMIAVAEQQVDVLQTTFAVLSGLSSQDKISIFKQVSVEGSNCLMVAISQKADISKLLEKINLLPEEDRQEIFTQKNNSGLNWLMIAIRHHPVRLPALLKVICKLSAADRKAILLELQSKDWETCFFTMLKIENKFDVTEMNSIMAEATLEEQIRFIKNHNRDIRPHVANPSALLYFSGISFEILQDLQKEYNQKKHRLYSFVKIILQRYIAEMKSKPLDSHLTKVGFFEFGFSVRSKLLSAEALLTAMNRDPEGETEEMRRILKDQACQQGRLHRISCLIV